MEFKAGDMVRVVGPSWSQSDQYLSRMGEVEKGPDKDGDYWVVFGYLDGTWFPPSSLELINSTPEESEPRPPEVGTVEAFVADLVTRARAVAERKGYCDEFEVILKELGLVKPKKRRVVLELEESLFDNFTYPDTATAAARVLHDLSEATIQGLVISNELIED